MFYCNNRKRGKKKRDIHGTISSMFYPIFFKMGDLGNDGYNVTTLWSLTRVLTHYVKIILKIYCE